MSKRNTVYKNGAYVRMHNKSINFIETEENKILIQFRKVDKEADSPACKHTCIKGVVRQTEIAMSSEAMDRLVHAYIAYKKSKLK